jgi:hypothetical protein
MDNKYFYLKRMGIGIAAMVAAGLLLDITTPRIFDYDLQPNQFFFFQLLPSLEAAVWSGLVAFVGAYVAGVRFVIPAIAYFSLISVLAFHLLFLIAQPAQPISYLEIAARNSLGTALGLVVVVVAAELGTTLSRKRAEAAR